MTQSSHNVESRISFLSSDGSTKLSGILSLPAVDHQSSQKLPALLFIAGSGPLDADGTASATAVSPALPINIQKQLSVHLTDRLDLVTLRFDKRGIKESANPSDPNLFYKAGITELVSDIVGAYHFLAAHERVDNNRIILVGHSEGCMLIPATNRALTAASPSSPPIFAAAFLSGLGISLVSATAYQRRLLSQEIKSTSGFLGFILRAVYGSDPQANIEAKAQQQFEAWNASKDDFSSALFGMIKTPVKWWREHGEYTIPGKLEEDYAMINFHVLGMTGDYDIQTDPSTLDQDLTALLPHAASLQVHRLPKVSHTLRECDKPNTFKDMKADLPAQCKMPVAEAVVEKLATWIGDVLGRSSGGTKTE
ncbi:hypothetical protein HDU93_007491 [Gonapodya sp. JEL0774]|nr:hypothetical protein HDU93_007491 [Gonapodya sp. JEL0774]